MTVLVIAEHDNNEFKPANYNTLAAAAQLGTEIEVLVAGAGCRAVADAAAAVPGGGAGAAGGLPGLRARPGGECRSAGGRSGEGLQPCDGARHDHRQESDAAHCRPVADVAGFGHYFR